MYLKVHVFEVAELYFDRECFRFRFDIYPIKNFKIISNLLGSKSEDNSAINCITRKKFFVTVEI